MQQLIQKIQNDCTNTDSTNNVHYNVNSQWNCPGAHDWRMFLRSDARRTQRNVRTDQRVFGLWSVAQTTAGGTTASAKVKAAESNGGPVAFRRQWSPSASYFLLLRWPASASTVTSFCFWPAPMEGQRPHPEVYHRMR